MALTNQQREYVRIVQLNANILAGAIKDSHEQSEVYFDRSYGASGSREITDADLVADNIDMTATELAAYITLCEQLQNLVGNAAVTTADYGSTLNNARALGN